MSKALVLLLSHAEVVSEPTRSSSNSNTSTVNFVTTWFWDTVITIAYYVNKYWPFFHNLAEKDHPASAQLKYQFSFCVNIVVLAGALTVCSAIENLLQDSTYQMIMHVIN